MAYRKYSFDYWGDKKNVIGTFGARWFDENKLEVNLSSDYWLIYVGYHPESDMGLVFMEGPKKGRLILMGEESKMNGLIKLIKNSAKTKLKIKEED